MMPTMRRVVLALRPVVRLLLHVLPARRHVVVHGWPDDEANTVEVLRALLRRYRGTVVWLLDDLSYRGPAYAVAELGRATRVRKGSVRSVRLALTAEATFFTHGLFTAVDPPESRLVVNLWHGDGPKHTRNTHLVRSTVVVAGTRLWGAQRAQRFRVPPERVAVVGNARVDQMRVPPGPDALRRLGLRGDRPILLWLPTYRQASFRDVTVLDADALSASAAVAQVVAGLAQGAREHGVQLVVKPHPLDTDPYDALGLRVTGPAQLRAAGVGLYQLMGVADAVVSDVSSVWTDYLALDRPVGFYVPDLEEVQAGRGLNVDDVLSLLPGPRIVTASDARAFVAGVAQHDGGLRPSRHPGFTRIGPTTSVGVADALLDWLDDFQRSRGRPVLFEG